MRFWLPLLGRVALIASMAIPTYAFFDAVLTKRSWSCPTANAVATPTETPTLKPNFILPGAEHLVSSAEFGIKSWNEENGDYVFTPTTVLPVRAGTTFGWRMKLKDPTKSVQVREVFRLPARPDHWGYTDDTHLLDDGQLAITDQKRRPLAGMIDHSWVISEGDPLGAYNIQVLIDDVLVARFDFTGVQP